MRRFALLIILLSGCSTSIGGSQPGAADAEPINLRETPEDKEGTGTAPGCDGITARGECQQGTAVYCDLERGRKRSVDCKATGQECILDIGRGARCKALEEDTGPGSGDASPCKDSGGISEHGFCTADGTAVYCDTKGDAPIAVVMKCSDFGKTCAVGQADCATGAFCCGDGTEPEPEVSECGAVTLKGTCEGDVAVWCGQVSGMHMDDCAAENKRCEVDTCATGAYCCGLTSEATPEQVQCAELGLKGECTSNDTVATYCLNDAIVNKECTGTKVCEFDTCGYGSACCEPAPPPSNECTTLGYNGECKDDQTVRFCVGTEDSDITEFSCTDGKTCTVVEGDANCRETVNLCPGLGIEGTCDGNTLQYCIGDNLYDSDCTTTGKTCQVNTCYASGANCCE